jgi:FtsZ-binding cell division protein ZapB
MPEWLAQILVTGGVPLLIVAGGYFANRRLGISSGQKTLVETLQGEVAALKERDKRREDEFQGCKSRLEHVEQVNEDLKDEVFKLRTELTKLVMQQRRSRTTRTRKDDAA